MLPILSSCPSLSLPVPLPSPLPVLLFPQSAIPTDASAKTSWLWNQQGILELCHNWSEAQRSITQSTEPIAAAHAVPSRILPAAQSALRGRTAWSTSPLTLTDTDTDTAADCPSADRGTESDPSFKHCSGNEKEHKGFGQSAHTAPHRTPEPDRQTDRQRL